MNFKRWFSVCLSPDVGAGEGGAPADVATAPEPQAAPQPETAPEVPQYERPKYFSQVAPAKADSEEYKALWKYQRLDELADAAIALQKENEGLKADASRSIVVPDGKDPEAVKEFARKLGVPDAPDGYALKSMAGLSIDDATMKILKESCHRAMLSEKQAEVFGSMLMRVSRKGLETTKALIEDRKNKFDANLMASYTELEHEADRQNAADMDKAAFRSFMEETGLAKVFDSNGTAYNPSVVKSIAAYARKHSGQVQVDAVPGGKKPEEHKTSNYGSEFYKRYGGK